jgi:hypothetical protein
VPRSQLIEGATCRGRRRAVHTASGNADGQCKVAEVDPLVWIQRAAGEYAQAGMEQPGEAKQFTRRDHSEALQAPSKLTLPASFILASSFWTANRHTRAKVPCIRQARHVRNPMEACGKEQRKEYSADE